MYMSELIKEKIYNDREARWKKKSAQENSESTPIVPCMSGCHTTCYHSQVFPRIWMNQESKWILENKRGFLCLSVQDQVPLRNFYSEWDLAWPSLRTNGFLRGWGNWKCWFKVIHVFSITKVCGLATLLTCKSKYLQLVAEREPKLSNT